MAVAEEFVFKIPKAKDLPPSWFELVLRPEKFQEHLHKLEKSPLAEPSPLVLIATFLEKAGRIEGQAIPEGFQISEDRRQVLLDCAYFMASFLHWDLTLLEKGLPAAVVYSLLTSLTKTFPLVAPLSENSPATITAHILFSDWVLRSLTEEDLARRTPQGLLWEGTCFTTEKINELLQLELDSALRLAAEVCKLEQSAFPLPCTSLKLQSPLGQAEPTLITIPHSVAGLSRDQLRIQLSFDMGQILFKQEKYAMAQEKFGLCEQLLSSGGQENRLSAKQQAHSIGMPQLHGYLSACSCLLGEPVIPSHDNSLAIMEKKRENMAESNGLVDLLSESTSFWNLSNSYKTCLETESSDRCKLVVGFDDHLAKRPKLEPAQSVAMSTYVSLWNGVSGVAGGSDVTPQMWSLLSRGDKSVLEALFSLVSMALEGVESDSPSWKRLAGFMKSVCAAHPQWREIPSSPLLLQLLSEVPPPSSDSLTSDGELPKAGSLLCQILSSPTPSKLLDLVLALLKDTPSSEHGALATKCQGSKPHFATTDLIPKLQYNIQYNLLLHRADSLALNEEYATAIDFSLAALGISATRGYVPAATYPKLRPILEEHVLKMRVLLAEVDMKRGGLESAQQIHGQHIRDVEQFYTNNQASDTSAIVLAAVFLLNMQQYKFVAQHELFNAPDKVCQRLAVAALCLKEGQETRKCTRDLFETISAIFSGGSVSHEKKLQRKCLEVICMHLQDISCLSYLMAALIRLWNMIQKPDFEVSSELPSHWPTAIGNASSINPGHVLRVLESTLKHALQSHPMRTAWIVARADLLTANGSYGAALQRYMEVGAQDSKFFELEVSENVWSQQVYHKMIYCCSNLDYHTQAVIFCQFLSPPDYNFTFSLLKDSISDILQSMFEYLWDMTLIEFLIYTLAKQGDGVKQAAAVQVACQPELNTHNHGEILTRAVHVRQRKFLRTLYITSSQYL